MNNPAQHNEANPHCHKQQFSEELFEQNAGVVIHKGKERYRGGSGYYAARAKPECPNVMDEKAGRRKGSR